MPGLPPCPLRGSPGQGCRRSTAAVWARGARLSPRQLRPPLISMRLASISSACTFLPPHSSGLTLPALPAAGLDRPQPWIRDEKRPAGERVGETGRQWAGELGRGGEGCPSASKQAVPAARRGWCGLGIGGKYLRGAASDGPRPQLKHPGGKAARKGWGEVREGATRRERCRPAPRPGPLSADLLLDPHQVVQAAWARGCPCSAGTGKVPWERAVCHCLPALSQGGVECPFPFLSGPPQLASHPHQLSSKARKVLKGP